MVNRKTLKCRNCGKEFTVSKYKRSDYCSQKCRIKFIQKNNQSFRFYEKMDEDELKNSAKLLKQSADRLLEAKNYNRVASIIYNNWHILEKFYSEWLHDVRAEVAQNCDTRLFDACFASDIDDSNIFEGEELLEEDYPLATDLNSVHKAQAELKRRRSGAKFVPDIITRVAWKADPYINDARLLTMPNIVKPFQGSGCQPRTILGKEIWDKMRIRCYAHAGFCCEICGAPSTAQEPCQAHEVFNTYYRQSLTQYQRIVCLCPSCHQFIHSGRLITRYKRRQITKEALLKVLEHGMQLIYKWKQDNSVQDTVRIFSAVLSCLKLPDVEKDIEKLIKKYEISFYHIPKALVDRHWSDWQMAMNGKVYPTPYATQMEYIEAMQNYEKQQVHFKSSQ